MSKLKTEEDLCGSDNLHVWRSGAQRCPPIVALFHPALKRAAQRARLDGGVQARHHDWTVRVDCVAADLAKLGVADQAAVGAVAEPKVTGGLAAEDDRVVHKKAVGRRPSAPGHVDVPAE